MLSRPSGMVLEQLDKSSLVSELNKSTNLTPGLESLGQPQGPFFPFRNLEFSNAAHAMDAIPRMVLIRLFSA